MNVSADGVAEFICSANADYINWEVDGIEPNGTGITQSGYMINFQQCLKVRSLTMNASSVCYNISNIKCLAFSIINSTTVQCTNLSEPPATYYVFGKSESLPPPSPHLGDVHIYV